MLVASVESIQRHCAQNTIITVSQQLPTWKKVSNSFSLIFVIIEHQLFKFTWKHSPKSQIRNSPLIRFKFIAELLVFRDCNHEITREKCTNEEIDGKATSACYTACDTDGCNNETVTSSNSLQLIKARAIYLLFPIMVVVLTNPLLAYNVDLSLSHATWSSCWISDQCINSLFTRSLPLRPLNLYFLAKTSLLAS